MEKFNENQVIKFETDDFILPDDETVESLSKKFDVKITPKEYNYRVYEIEGKFDNIMNLYNRKATDEKWLANMIWSMVEEYNEKH